MSLTKSFFDRETNITAKVICDSINEEGIRLTTFEIEYPRFIHSELMTHRTLSKNSSSSRAIPIQKMIDYINDNGALPLYWGKTKSGMQADDELDVHNKRYAVDAWDVAKEEATASAFCLSEYGLHKQTVNRLLEPFQMMKVVITGTDWDNFFNLRIHPDAQPEICMLAYKMYEAMQESSPNILYSDEYHLPYIVSKRDGTGSLFYFDNEDNYLTLADAIKISAASCASVSYRTEGITLEKAERIFDMLIKAEVVHSSPFEHLATPIKKHVCVFKDNDYVFADSEVDLNESVNLIHENKTWEEGVTHVNKQGELCSGNLRGWIQYRHLLPNNTCYSFDFEERMKLFDGGLSEA